MSRKHRTDKRTTSKKSNTRTLSEEVAAAGTTFNVTVGDANQIEASDDPEFAVIITSAPRALRSIPGRMTRLLKMVSALSSPVPFGPRTTRQLSALSSPTRHRSELEEYLEFFHDRIGNEECRDEPEPEEIFAPAVSREWTVVGSNTGVSTEGRNNSITMFSSIRLTLIRGFSLPVGRWVWVLRWMSICWVLFEIIAGIVTATYRASANRTRFGITPPPYSRKRCARWMRVVVVEIALPQDAGRSFCIGVRRQVVGVHEAAAHQHVVANHSAGGVPPRLDLGTGRARLVTN
ncbi:hypothetical protein C8R45DRAFT_932347 [Mycena sanguinolenta]|nr:hypothetical protein C8R45DRAFT_932347 [Mycena sanguinolenta]